MRALWASRPVEVRLLSAELQNPRKSGGFSPCPKIRALLSSVHFRSISANAIKLLSQILKYAEQQGWCQGNPCRLVARPRVRRSADIRFLDRDELAAFLATVDVSAKPYGRTDRVLFLTAAMTGIRQGELLALRWRDVDWRAKRVRVRRNYVRGHLGKPKSKSGADGQSGRRCP